MSHCLCLDFSRITSVETFLRRLGLRDDAGTQLWLVLQPALRVLNKLGDGFLDALIPAYLLNFEPRINAAGAAPRD